MAMAAPGRSSAPSGAGRSVIGPPGASDASATMASQASSATTSTSAPAAESSSAFHTAGSPPPATITFLPARAKKTGSRASGSMRPRFFSRGGGGVFVSSAPKPWQSRP